MLIFCLVVGAVGVTPVSSQLLGCSDAITNCSTIGPAVCENRTYAEANCKEYCLMCVDFTLPPYAPCIDLSQDCDQVNCSMDPITNFATINCRKKCGVCQDTPMETELTKPVIDSSTAATPKETELTRPVLFRSTTERCVDRGMNCTEDSCTTQFGWEYCIETCGLCGNDSTFPAAPTTTQLPTTKTTMKMTTTSAAMITGFRCVDLNDNCTQDDCDAPDYTYARVYCVESCMLCNNDTLPGTESPKPSSSKPITTVAPSTTNKPSTESSTTQSPSPKPVTTKAPVQTTVATEKPPTEGPKSSPGPVLCSPSAELVFVLDASSSVGGANFQTMLGFTQNVTARLKSDYDKLNVTVVTFSNTPQVAVSFNQDADLSTVLKAEANVTYTHGGTQTDTALALMTQQYNFGNNNQKVAIVITDGASFDPAKTKAQAQLAKDKGVTIFAIAVGDDVNPVETKAISSDPDNRYHYILSTFSGLQAIVDELHVNDCKTTTTQATTTVKETVPTQTVPSTASLGPQTAAPKTPTAVPATMSAVPTPATTVKQETPAAVITTTTEPPKTAAPAITTTEQPKTVTQAPATVTTAAPSKTASPIVTNKPATIMTTTTEPPTTASPVTVTTGAPVTIEPTTKITAKPQTLSPSTEKSSTAAPSQVSTQGPSKLPPTTVTSLKPETLAPSPSTTQLPASTGAPVQISTNSPPKLSSTIINTLKPGTISPSPKTTQKPATASPGTVSTEEPKTNAPTTVTTLKPDTLAPSASTTQIMSTKSPVQVSTQSPTKQPPTAGSTLKPNTLAPATSTTEKITASPITVSTQAPSKLPPTTAKTLKPNTVAPTSSTRTQQVTASPSPISSKAPSTIKPDTLAPTQTTTTNVEVTTEVSKSTAAPVTVTTKSPETMAPITTTTAKPQTQAPITTTQAPATTTEAKTSAPVSSSSASQSTIPPSSARPTTQRPTTQAPNTVTTMTPGTKAPTTEKATTTNPPATTEKIVTSTSAPQTVSTKAPETLAPSSSAKPQTLAPSSSVKPQTLPPSSSAKPQTLAPSSSAKPQTLPPSSSAKPQTLAPSSSAKPQTLPPSSSAKPQTLAPSSTTNPPTLAPSPPSTESPATIPLTTTTSPPAVTTTTEQRTTTTEKPSTTTASCVAKVADIVFVVDSSGSIGENNFNVVKQFIKDVVNTFDVDDRYTRVGLVEFSNTANIEFKLADHTNLTDLEKAIDAVTYSGGGTLTSDALELMRIEGFERERPLAPDVAIVITDGLSKYPPVTQAQANLAKADGITMFSIGIGNESVQSELEAIASDKRFVFQVGDFSALATLDNVIAHTACGVVLPETYQNRSTTERPTTPSGCVDIDSNCDSYPRDSCSDFEPYARAHCPRTCGFCPGFPIVNPDCKDNIADCESYGTSVCYDPQQYSWVEKNCLASCGFCEDKSKLGVQTTTVATTVTTQAVCEDKVKNCIEYGGPSVCTDPSFKSWVKENCRKFCGICYTYTYVTAVPRGKENCPAWTVPEECKLEYKAGQCCPFPVCPSGYRLAVRRA